MEINESNFSDYFFDIRKNRPKKDQILAKFTAMADFTDDWVKRNVIDLLLNNEKGAEFAHRVMRNLVCATESSGIKVLKEIAIDLANGKSVEEVSEKPYRFQIEQFYWTQKECVPENPHWTTITILNDSQESQTDVLAVSSD